MGIVLVPEVDGRVRFEDIKANWSSKIKLVALSAVQWCSGYRLDWENVASWNNPLCYDLVFRKGMRRFQYSTLNYADIVQWSRGLELVESLGMESIEKQLLKIVNGFRNMVEGCGGKIYGEFQPSCHSGIISFTHPRLSSDDILRKLAAQDVLAQVRDGRVRIAPHVYLEEEDIARFGIALAKVVGH